MNEGLQYIVIETGVLSMMAEADMHACRDTYSCLLEDVLVSLQASYIASTFYNNKSLSGTGTQALQKLTDRP